MLGMEKLYRAFWENCLGLVVMKVMDEEFLLHVKLSLIWCDPYSCDTRLSRISWWHYCTPCFYLQSQLLREKCGTVLWQNCSMLYVTWKKIILVSTDILNIALAYPVNKSPTVLIKRTDSHHYTLPSLFLYLKSLLLSARKGMSLKSVTEYEEMDSKLHKT